MRYGVIGWLVLAIVLASCRQAVPVIAPEAATPVLKTFSQWAVSAEASSQFGFPDWSVRRATGAPEVGACVDDPRAWSSGRGSGLEWLQLTYAAPVYVTEVRVHQTFGRGAISRISLIGEDGTVEEIWSGTDVTAPCPGILAVPVSRTAYRVTSVRIDLDESRTGFWNQVDAVELVGVR
ncbi:MAG: hypothetical protein JXA21_19575 [Anaerolineae bacterium]|nr:hypothetical protein [Anaerolineae bacterium]